MAFTSQESPRRQIDATKSVSIALPIISATTNTNIIDLEMVSTYPSLEKVAFIAQTGAATANSGNAAAINMVLQHSATNNAANMVNVPNLVLVSIASNAATYPATNASWTAPVGLYRYVQLQVAQGAGGSNAANTANVTFSLAF